MNQNFSGTSNKNQKNPRVKTLLSASLIISNDWDNSVPCKICRRLEVVVTFLFPQPSHPSFTSFLHLRSNNLYNGSGPCAIFRGSRAQWLLTVGLSISLCAVRHLAHGRWISFVIRMRRAGSIPVWRCQDGGRLNHSWPEHLLPSRHVLRCGSLILCSGAFVTFFWTSHFAGSDIPRKRIVTARLRGELNWSCSTISCVTLRF